MLLEEKKVRQLKNEGSRRWFSSEFFDLIVWYDKRESIKGFQLCYNKLNDERALTWLRKKGFSHKKVDEGEDPAHLKMSPILVPDGIFAKETIAMKFKHEAKKVDLKITQFVYKKLLEYPV